jgi:ABC-2 type transport system permease protein
MSATTLDPPLRATRAPGPTLGRLTTIELRKMVDTRAGFWLLVSIGLVTVATVAVKLIWPSMGGEDLERFFVATVQSTSVLLPVLGILAVTSEWSQRTALATFSLVPRRERVIVAKLLAAGVLALLAVVVCLVASVLGTVLATGAGWSLPLDVVVLAVPYQLLGLLAGLAFGLVLMNSPAAIVLYFVVPSIVAALSGAIPGFEDIAKWLDVLSAEEPLISGSMSGAEWAHLATAAALWIGLPLAGGFARLRRRELA